MDTASSERDMAHLSTSTCTVGNRSKFDNNVCKPPGFKRCHFGGVVEAFDSLSAYLSLAVAWQDTIVKLATSDIAKVPYGVR